ncbi:BOI-related E3 ubiquitin-protein ligase 1-like [Hibiscus syriacus]|nr:BOI-related E3 ubiquitin-protein ligase 1-like [Hibiscus syriacus]
MAVQTQYPSNALLNRNGREENEFPFQQQAGGVFLDQSHMLFNNNSDYNNPRKRGREVEVADITTTPMNSYSLQTQPTQLIDISQLPQPNIVSTGLRLSFDDRQQKLQKNHNQSYRQQQNFVLDYSAFLPMVSDDLVTQIKRQRDELDYFLQSQGEELRRTLAEKRQRHYCALLEAAEESAVRSLREKEAEVEKAKRRNVELETRAVQLSLEAQVWQKKARTQEATAASLQAQLQQAIKSGGGAAGQDSMRGEEGRKCVGGGLESQAEDAESAYVDPERVAASGPSCKACRTRVAAVVLLPCRHLCLCTACDRLAQTCPICLTVRHSSVEVFLS